MMKILKFSLSSPLQSWGEEAPWDNRVTSLFPTKSAIVGMIAAAFGYKRGDDRIVEICKAIRIAVRADRSGTVCRDFNSIHSNTDYMVNAQGEGRLLTGRKVRTLVSNKYYLQDSRFTVFVYGENELIQNIAQALLSPVFLLYLGRKNCPLTEPLIPEILDTDNIFEAVREFSEKESRRADDRVLVEMDYNGLDHGTKLRRVYSRKDNIVQSVPNRVFSDRKVCSFYVDSKY